MLCKIRVRSCRLKIRIGLIFSITQHRHIMSIFRYKLFVVSCKSVSDFYSLRMY